MNRADSIRDYLTGAASDGAVQIEQSLSLGNFRSLSEWGGLAMYVENAINNLTIDFASGANDLGEGTLQSFDGNMVAWKDGDAVQILNGETKLVETSNPGQFLRVTRHSALNLETKACTITLSSPFNNVYGFSNINKTVALAGANQYRGIIVKNISSVSISNFKRWIAELGTAAVSDSAQLGGAGPGTITTTGNFDDWPTTGYCHIFTSGGTSREIVYYDSRTSTSLDVTARALLGTASSAGAATDVLRSVPGIAIATDTAGITAPGAIQTIANETTAPVGVTWNVGVTEATGLQIGNMNTGQQVGIWIWKHIPAATFLSLAARDKINSSFER